MTEKRCLFYLEKKKRFCRLTPAKNSEFCGEHTPKENVTEDDPLLRIPCPYDPKHSCYANLLRTHLKRCNARPGPPQPYFVKSLNNGSLGVEEPPEKCKILAELTVEEIGGLIEQIRLIHSQMMVEEIGGISQEFGFHPACSSEFLRTDVGEFSMKHTTQTSSLLSILERRGILKDYTAFIEFGAGKGGLTYWIATINNYAGRHNCVYYPLDRSSYRFKRENKLKELNVPLHRIKIDIQDLKLEELEGVKEMENTVGLTKHLCGCATDLALRSLLETNGSVSKVSGLVFGTCCHHRCNWDSFVGREELIKFGIKQEYFRALVGMSGWATCGTGFSKFDKEEDEGIEEINNPKYQELGLTIGVRRNIGRMVKELIDLGRVRYIRNFGLNAFLCHYTDLETTYENMAIVAENTPPKR